MPVAPDASFISFTPPPDWLVEDDESALLLLGAVVRPAARLAVLDDVVDNRSAPRNRWYRVLQSECAVSDPNEHKYPANNSILRA